jgi:hypothetical protein
MFNEMNYMIIMYVLLAGSAQSAGAGAGARYLGKRLGALSQLHHGVRGVVHAVDARTIYLQDFHYDGAGPGTLHHHTYPSLLLGSIPTGKAEELDGPAISALRRAIAEVKQRWSVSGWVTKNLLSRALPCFGRHVKSIVPAAFAVVSTYQPAMGPRSGLWPVLHKEGLCPSSGDINRLMIEADADSGFLNQNF